MTRWARKMPCPQWLAQDRRPVLALQLPELGF